MSVSIERFDEFFRELWGYSPFPWQTRLANQTFSHGWPGCIDLPTASGKTAAIEIAVFVLACQAHRPSHERTVGRRIFFAVNRRVIVDDAFRRAHDLATILCRAEANNDAGILGVVARALRSLNEEPDPTKAPPLDRVQLRGGIYRDRAWARSITQPMVACTTADQLGSRLLFRGYGVSASSAPIHAALCCCDSLVLLDEAHVTKAFCQTMQFLERYQRVRTNSAAPIPPMRFVQMTATPAGEVKNRFELDDADRSEPVLKARQEASKPAALATLAKKKPVADEIVARAFDALSDTRKAVGIIVNRVQTARDVERRIQEEIARRTRQEGAFQAQVHLVIGRMRPIDRDVLEQKLRTLVGPERPNVLETPIFVVATQCLEVGADYDFDALITEAASLDALRQRFGRLNRRGRTIEAAAAIVVNEESLKGRDPIYGDALKHTWEWLWSNKDHNGQVDFGIAGFKPLWARLEAAHPIYLDDDSPQRLLSPAPNAAVLLPAHLDALCQTSPQPMPSPDVSLFIHGPQRDMAEVNVCWRADLGDNEKHWPDIVRLLPPTSAECMVVPLWEVRRWMRGEDGTAGADVATATHDESPRRNADETQARTVTVYRGQKNIESTDDPSALRPGDTVVMPVSSRSWRELGHIPNVVHSSYDRRTLETDDEWAARRQTLDCSVDVAERAARQSKLRLAIRLHDAFSGRADLREVRAGELRPLLRKLLAAELVDEDERRRALNVLERPFERHAYSTVDDEDSGTKHNELILFRALIEPPNRLLLPASDEDDGDDNLNERDRFVTLDDHSAHVADRFAAALAKLPLSALEPTLDLVPPLHDLGKADVRFQAMLASITPYEAMLRLTLLGKGDGQRLTSAEKAAIRARAMLPANFRHELTSLQIVERQYGHLAKDANVDCDLLLHLIAAHHGYARPFAPVVVDDARDETLSIEVGGITITADERAQWPACHRFDSGVAERFWKLTKEYGWWGLAWLEAVFRLADWQASAAEQEGTVVERVANDKPAKIAVGQAAQHEQKIDERANSILCKGLDGSNPLAFLAALGTLRTLSLALPDETVTMSWEQQEGAWRPRLWCSLASDGDALIETLKDILVSAVDRASFAIGDNLNLPTNEFRAHLLKSIQNVETLNNQLARIDADFLAAFGSEVVVNDDGTMQDTALRTMSGAGHQHFLKFFRQLVSNTDSDHLRRSLFLKWDYADEGRGMNLRWDPLDDRRYALRWKDPGPDPVKTMRGANRLAIEAMPLLPTMPTTECLATTAFEGKGSRGVYLVWPLWEAPISIDVLQSLLASVGRLRDDAVASAELGIAALYASARITTGKFRNFTPAAPIS